MIKPDLSEARRLLSANFHLVELHTNTKVPIGEGWNTRRASNINPQATGYGFVLANNKLCSIDSDSHAYARLGMKALGFDLEELMAAGARTVSTRAASGGRSTFHEEPDLAWLKFSSNETQTVLELRATSPNLQDCVPGVIYEDKNKHICTQTYHPDTRYKLDDRPPLPDNLLAFWQRCSVDIDFYKEAQIKFIKAISSTAKPHLAVSVGRGADLAFSAEGIRGPFNRENTVQSILERHSYSFDSKTQRYAPPTATGQAGVREVPGKEGLWRSDHASDPLFGTFDAWVAHVVLDHGGVLDQAIAAQPERVKPIVEQVNNSADALANLMKFKTTDEMMENIENSKFAWMRLIVQGHVCAVVAKPNGGKTTLMTFAAGEMARAGYQVMYVNVDAGAADLKTYHQHAKSNGYMLLAPDMIEGKSAKDVTVLLAGMALGGGDLSNIVLIFDTLKKFVEVMNKSQGKAFYSLLRKLTALGMTAVLLAHTNKYEDDNGMPIYEGTADLKSDIDELIYLISVKASDGSITVSTKIDKSRSDGKDATFYISPSREVSVAEQYVDTLEQVNILKQQDTDSAVIDFILEHIAIDCKSLTQLTTIAKETKSGYSRNRLKGVLDRYYENPEIRKWDRTRSMTSGYIYFVQKQGGGSKH